MMFRKFSAVEMANELLFKGVWNLNLQDIEEAIAKGADVNSKESWLGRSALHLAACSGSVPAARLLLDAGAMIDIHDKYGVTPLRYAAENKAIATTRLLIARGADAGAKDPSGCTILEAARYQEAPDEIIVLLEAALLNLALKTQISKVIAGSMSTVIGADNQLLRSNNLLRKQL